MVAYLSDNPTAKAFSKKKGNVDIVRIAPFDCGVLVEFRVGEKVRPRLKLIISRVDSREKVCEQVMYYKFDTRTVLQTGLTNGVDYIAELIVCDEDLNELARSNARLFRCGYFPGKIIDYIHPDDETFMESGEFVGSPQIIKTSSARYLACHDVFCHDGSLGHGCLCRFFVSYDGENWSFLSEIPRCTWGTVFEIKGRIYIVGTNIQIVDSGIQNRMDLVLYYSDDYGASWSEPVVLKKSTSDTGYRATPTAYAIHNNRIWIEHGVQTNSRNGIAVLSACTDDDLTLKESWTDSEPVYYDSSWEGVVPEWNGIMFEEGNVVITPEGELKIFERFNSHPYGTKLINPDMVRTAVLKINTENPAKPPEFEKTVPFSAGMHKFYIVRDEENSRYLALGNRMTIDNVSQRNILSLYSSEDLEKWTVERDLINLEDVEWYEPYGKYGYQYPTFILENGEILAVVRTALNGADNFHNSNAMTFHRFKNIKDKYTKR